MNGMIHYPYISMFLIRQVTPDDMFANLKAECGVGINLLDWIEGCFI